MSDRLRLPKAGSKWLRSNAAPGYAIALLSQHLHLPRPALGLSRFQLAEQCRALFRRRTTAPLAHCRIEPYLDQGGAQRAPRGRHQRQPLALGRPRPARVGPNAQYAPDQLADPGCIQCGALSSSSAVQRPAPGRCVEVAPCGRVARDRLRRTSTQRPLARVPAPVEEDGAEQERG
jgi:hypothetical protein